MPNATGEMETRPSLMPAALVTFGARNVNTANVPPLIRAPRSIGIMEMRRTELPDFWDERQCRLSAWSGVGRLP